MKFIQHALLSSALVIGPSAMAASTTYDCGALNPPKGTGIIAGGTRYKVVLNNGIGGGGELLSKSGRGVGDKWDSTPLTLKHRGMEASVYVAGDIQVNVLAQTMGISKKGPLVNISRAANSEWNAVCKAEK
jgi:hypothetical protein